LRKAIGKKNKELMIVLEREFIDGAVNKGYNEVDVTKLWNQILKFADYCFNKSHSYAYTMLSYWSMYLKVYHTNEFIAAKLSCDMKDTSELRKDFYEFKKDTEFFDPCINKSDESFVLSESTGVMIGLGAIKGLGNLGKEIIKYRPYDKIAQFFDKVKIDKSQLISLIYAGAFDCFEKDKSVLLGNVERFLKFNKDKSHSTIIELFDPSDVFDLDLSKCQIPPDASTMERACYGFNLRHGFINERRWVVEHLKDNHVVGTITDVKRTKTKKSKEDMAIVSIYTHNKTMKVLLFGQEYEKYNNLLVKETTCGFTGELKEGEEPTIFVTKMCDECSIKITRADVTIKLSASNERLKERFDLLMSTHENGDTTMSLFKSNAIGEAEYVYDYERKILYNRALHSFLKDTKFEIVLEIF
jgi:DNA polymerase III alpha subunit